MPIFYSPYRSDFSATPSKWRGLNGLIDQSLVYSAACATFMRPAASSTALTML
jgi:hypothetical protein